MKLSIGGVSDRILRRRTNWASAPFFPASAPPTPQHRDGIVFVEKRMDASKTSAHRVLVSRVMSQSGANHRG